MYEVMSTQSGNHSTSGAAQFSQRLGLTLLVFLVLTAVGCDSTSNSDDPDPVQTTMVADLAADPFVAFDSLGRPVGSGNFAFYSLANNAEVASADSASMNWDVAFRGTTVLINGGTSGPGGGGAVVMEAAFEEVDQAPSTGYSVDSATGYAVPAGSGNGWYNYNAPINLVTPIPGRVLVIRTADGRYAKVRMLSYYRGAPETPDSTTDEARYLSFEFAFQADGSTSF